MNDFSRRKFLKASVVSVGVTATVEGCSDGVPAKPSSPAAPDDDPPVKVDARPDRPPPRSSSEDAAIDAGARPPAADAAAARADSGVDAAGMGPMPPGEMGPAGMPRRALGKTGLMVSIVGFGSGSQYLGASEAEAERLIHRAIELGINYFDTAHSYGSGRSYARLGKYLVPTHRDKIVLVSKTLERTAEGAKRQLDETLTALKTDHLDIFHFHEISTGDADRILAKGGAYEAVMRAKEQGLVRFVGLTGHSTGAILVDALKRIRPDVMMCPQNAAREQGFTEMVIPYGHQQGIGLLGMKVTAQDALIRNGVKPEELVRYSLSLPVSAMIIGMSSMGVLESCGSIARTLKPLTESEMMQVTGKLASVDMLRCLPYRRWGYHDGRRCWG